MRNYEAILKRVQGSLGRDCARYLSRFSEQGSGGTAYAFVLFVDSVHGYVGWRIFTAARLHELRVAGRDHGPDFATANGLKYNTRESPFEGDEVSAESEALLEEFREAAREDEYDPLVQQALIDCLVSVVQEMAGELQKLSRADEFVAFVSEYDSVDPDTVRRTVPADRIPALLNEP